MPEDKYCNVLLIHLTFQHLEPVSALFAEMTPEANKTCTSSQCSSGQHCLLQAGIILSEALTSVPSSSLQNMSGVQIE